MMNYEPITIDSAVVYATTLTKTAANEMAAGLSTAVNDGRFKPLEMLAKLKFAELTVKTAIDGIMDAAIDEASKYHKGEKITAMGCELSQKESGVRYDFTGCGDAVYDRMAAEMDALKERMKEREAFLKTVKEGMTVVDEESGEVMTIRPAAKQSKTIVEVRIGK